MEPALQEIMDRHQHCEWLYVNPIEMKNSNEVVEIIRTEVFFKSGLPAADVVFTAHLIEPHDSDKIIAVTADSKEHYAKLQENN